MSIINIVLLLLLMSAFAIGISVTDTDKVQIHGILNNATEQLSNISLTSQSNPENKRVRSFTLIVEKYVQFIGVLFFEVMKIGIDFGYDNPQYFEPEFILRLVQFIVWAVIISLLIKPVGYALAFIIVGAIALKEKIQKNAKRRKRK